MEKSGEAFKVFAQELHERYATRGAASLESHASGSQLGNVTDGTMHPSGCLRTRKGRGGFRSGRSLTDVIADCNTTFAAARRRSYCGSQHR